MTTEAACKELLDIVQGITGVQRELLEVQARLAPHVSERPGPEDENVATVLHRKITNILQDRLAPAIRDLTNAAQRAARGQADRPAEADA